MESTTEFVSDALNWGAIRIKAIRVWGALQDDPSSAELQQQAVAAVWFYANAVDAPYDTALHNIRTMWEMGGA